MLFMIFLKNLHFSRTFFFERSNFTTSPIFLFPPLLSPSFFHSGHCSIGFLLNGGETERIILFLMERLSENMEKPNIEATAIIKKKATFLSIPISFLFSLYSYYLKKQVHQPVCLWIYLSQLSFPFKNFFILLSPSSIFFSSSAYESLILPGAPNQAPS